MDEKSFEKYLFLKIYTVDFDSTLHFFKVIKRYKKKDIRYALLNNIVVTYARPFSQNRGKLINNHSLPLRFVPKDYRTLHNSLIKMRNQLFTHTDLTFRNPQVVNWSEKGRPRFPMSFRGFDYEQLERRLNEIESLLDQVRANLRQEIIKIETALCAEAGNANADNVLINKLAPAAGPLFFTGSQYDWEK